MKKNLIILLTAFSLSVCAQIKIVHENSYQLNNNATDSIVYDSLTNLVQKAGFSYMIGQRLMLIHSGVKEYKERYGDCVSSSADVGSHIAKYGVKGLTTDEPFLGKYFDIIGCEKKGKDYCLLLKDVESGEIYTNSGVDLIFNRLDKVFLCQGYYEKLKKQFVGQEYVFLKAEKSSTHKSIFDNKLYSVLTDEEIGSSIENASVWKCVDISVKVMDLLHSSSEFGCPVILVFEDVNGHKAYQYLLDEYQNVVYRRFYFKDIEDQRELFLGCFVTKEEQQRYLADVEKKTKEKAEREEALAIEAKQKESQLVKNYGATNAKLIQKGIVKLGWSKQMCIESWGKPFDINKTIGGFGVHEQWVYRNGRYLYFDNGKLTVIQE